MHYRSVRKVGDKKYMVQEKFKAPTVPTVF